MSSSRADSAKACSEGPDAPERRCECGKLLARATRGGLELKCSRCRRVVLIPWPEVGSDDAPV